jgi:hypothetical protein
MRLVDYREMAASISLAKISAGAEVAETARIMA